MDKKIKLKFMVAPEELASRAYVDDPVKIVITNPKAELLKQYLGQSGMRMAIAGFEFYFEKNIAEELIKKNIAINV